MNLSRKQFFAIVSSIILVSTFGTTFAVLYWTEEVNLTAGVASEGAAAIFEADGFTPLYEFTFEDFHPQPVMQTVGWNFVVKNLGNVPTYVTWQIAESSVTWDLVMDTTRGGNYYAETTEEKYYFWIDEIPYSDPGMWGAETDGIYLDVGESAVYSFTLRYSGFSNDAEVLTLNVHFNSVDAVD